MQGEDRRFVEKLIHGSVTWSQFLDRYAGVVYRVAGLFADTYDDRMDLFLHACERLRAQQMRKLRSFRYRDDAPCRFSTWLSVVIRNLAVDWIRSREGRFRPFRSIASLPPEDQALFAYLLRDGLPLEEARQRLAQRDGIRLSQEDAARRAAAIQALLSPGQRWRLLARLASRRGPVPIDPVAEVACTSGSGGTPLEAGAEASPESPMRSRDARRLFDAALAALAPRPRLAMMLRFRDGLAHEEAGRVMGIPGAEAESLALRGLDDLRERLRAHGVARPDLEPASLWQLWPTSAESGS
jgi:RNA polymerase sigma factor (sigma-70 family)